MKDYAEQIREQLQKLGVPESREGKERHFKEPVKVYGARSTDVTKVSKQTIKALTALKDEPKAKAFGLCEELWKSGYLEETGIACDISYFYREQYEPEDFSTFEKWLDKYVGNWAACDTLCNHTIAEFIMKYPDFMPKLKSWTSSPNRWKQRAAAVTLIIPARNGYFLRDIFEIADCLLPSKDDMVQKGYGWMLKATGEFHPTAVFEYLMDRKTIMPRTAFRYALEKLPPDMRAQAMEK